MRSTCFTDLLDGDDIPSVLQRYAQVAAVRDFMVSVCALFINFVHNAENLETKEQLIESVEEMKLS
jgi:hypothetical protein